MKGNGNGFATMFQKLYFMILPTSGQRSRYLKKHKDLFYSFGEGVFWQSRKFPADPELISIGNNVKIASDVIFVNHDIIHSVFNSMRNDTSFRPHIGCIAIGDNVMIGTGTYIMPNVRIGSNVIVGAGAVVTHDIPSGSVAGGVPAKVIGKFDDVLQRRMSDLSTSEKTTQQIWELFKKMRQSEK